MTHVDSLCNWRKGSSLLDLVMEAYRTVLTESDKSSNTKGVRFAEPVDKGGQLKVANKLINYLLQHQTNRLLLVVKNRPMLEELLTVCASVQDHVSSRVGFNDTSGVAPADIGEIVSVYGQLAMLLHPDTAINTVEELVSWSEREVLPLLDEDQENRTRYNVSLAQHVLHNIHKIVLSSISLCVGDIDHLTTCLDWSHECVSVAGPREVSGLLTMLTVIADTSYHKDGDTWRDVYQEKVPVSFAKFLNWLTCSFEQFRDTEDSIDTLKKDFSSFMRSYYKNRQKDHESWEDVVDVTIAALLAIITKNINDDNDVEQFDKVVTEMVEALVKVAGSDAIGVAVEKMLKDFETEVQNDKDPTLSAYQGLAEMINSKNKSQIVSSVERMKSALNSEREQE